MASVVALPDPLLAAFYYAMFSKAWVSECMCYQHTCTFDVQSRQCAIKAEASSRDSSNPFALLPPSGLACVLSEKSAVTGGEMCELRACNREEVSATGPFLPDGGHLWGHVGRRNDTAGIYNCPSTKGTLETQFAALDDVASPFGDGYVENTAASRGALLALYKPEL